MTALRLAPVALALAVLAAHFYRAAMFPFSALAIGAIALLWVPRAWAARTLQVLLVAGALEWLRTLAALVALRQSEGAPYLRLGAILGAVALLTALSALAFRARSVRARFRLGQAEPAP
jgi:hypothetical protein